MDMGLIYVVEDDRDISEIESFALKNSGYDVQVYENGADFYRAVRERVPIILVTAKTTELDKVRGLDMGADDYITKPFGVMELISRVRALLRRSGEDKGEKSLTIGKILLDGERHAVYVDGVLCELTYKEYELLRLLMQRAGIVTTREEILNHVWGSDFQGESRTLDMHIKTLRQKLGEAGGMIRTVRSVGYFLENDGSV